MSAQPFDFRRPGRLSAEAEDRLAAWLRATCTIASERMAGYLPYRPELALDRLDSVTAGELPGTLPELTVAFRIWFCADVPATLLVLARPLALALVAAMLGESSEAAPADRALTSVEVSLCECLVQDFVSAAQESWPGGEAISPRIDRVESNPRRPRVLGSEELFLLFLIAARGPFGEQSLQWVVPQERMVKQLNRVGGGDGAANTTRPQLERIAQELPVELTVALGSVELGVSQLARLRAGDLILLDQRVSEPLAAKVGGEVKFHGWPGRVGTRRAFQIESVGNER